MKMRILGLLCALLLAVSAAGMAQELAANEYIGENAYGMGGMIRVKVTMDGEKIAAIKAIEQRETRGLGTTAILQLADAMISGNTTDVEIIAGATLTSLSFTAAVRQAVETALGVDPAANVVLADNEYLGISENGLGGRVMVKVRLQDGKIEAIDILESHESPEIGDVALAEQVKKIAEAGSTEVDGISGATVTCKALAEAVEMALNSVE